MRQPPVLCSEHMVLVSDRLGYIEMRRSTHTVPTLYYVHFTPLSLFPEGYEIYFRRFIEIATVMVSFVSVRVRTNISADIDRWEMLCKTVFN